MNSLREKQSQKATPCPVRTEQRQMPTVSHMAAQYSQILEQLRNICSWDDQRDLCDIIKIVL